MRKAFAVGAAGLALSLSACTPFQQKLAKEIVACRQVHGDACKIRVAIDGGVGVHPGCFEDETCWDCSTMGNRQCGPVADRETES